MTSPNTTPFESSPPEWPDLSGRLSIRAGHQVHTLPVRVYFEDTDAGGIAYHGSYVRWCERGRSDFLRLLGTDARRLIDGSDDMEPAGFIVRRMTFDFFKPARMDDVLEINTTVLELGGASVKLSQVITRTAVTVCEAEVVLVLVATSGKPLRINDAMRAMLTPGSLLHGAVAAGVSDGAER
ncbi:MAG: YbgC/FadM family acyl-CoA thioesterase [Hyphomicrobiaceae bacterium]|nr:YbgC/FadM family acyl-CoA thioesterase [Hyphomicrobiaceae bacterium]